jgi:hypothetical protein
MRTAGTHGWALFSLAYLIECVVASYQAVQEALQFVVEAPLLVGDMNGAIRSCMA